MGLSFLYLEGLGGGGGGGGLVAKSCPTLVTLWAVCSLPDSSVHGILQARILEWVTIPFCMDLPNPGIEPMSLALQEDSLPSEAPGKPYQTK